uniref:Uncharacterized protein n=1 Tax=Phytophthora ramorum TaxID=164328 RepID=H3H708_PHYRM
MSVQSTFDHTLLKTLCKLDWEVPLESVTEERIITEIDKIVNNVKNGSTANIDALFDNELRIVLHESDVQARVVNYFKLCEDIISRNGLQNTFATSTGIAHKCTILRKNLQPTGLRDKVETHQKLIDKSSTKNDVALYKLVKQKALEQEKPWGDKSKVQPDASRVERPQATGSSQEAAKSKPRGGCFNCGKDHWLSESDWNIISHSHVQEPAALDQDVVEVELGEPVELEAVGGAVLTATPAELGIDVDRELEQLAARNLSNDDAFGDPTGIQFHRELKKSDGERFFSL